MPPFCAYALGFLCVCVCCSNIRVFGTRTVEPVRKARTSYRRQILFFSPTEAPLLSMATRYSPLLSFWSHFPSSLMPIKRVRGDVCSVRSLSKWPGKLCKRVEPVSSKGKRGGVKPRDCARLNSSLSMQHHALETIVGVFPGPQRNTTWRFWRIANVGLLISSVSSVRSLRYTSSMYLKVWCVQYCQSLKVTRCASVVEAMSSMQHTSREC